VVSHLLPEVTPVTVLSTGPARLAYSPDEIAELTGCSRQHIYNLMSRGELRSVKLGRSRRILHDDLVALLERNVVTPGGAT
jgi:excisionase family DNA binding protein